MEKEALQENRFNDFLKISNESGESSFQFLQNVYSNSNVHEQGLSLALAIAKRVLGDKGASRVHGGGFAGTTQAFVPDEFLDDYIEALSAVFGDDSCYVLNIRPIGGTQIKA